MTINQLKYTICTALLGSANVFASCNALYPMQTPIVPAGTAELCNSFYVTRYYQPNNAVILVSEKLSKQAAVGSITRLNAFKADIRVSSGVTPKEYAHSGYDKGHMAPADDAATLQEMKETFLMTNMTPQAPMLNRVAWKALEGKVRKIYENAQSDVYVVTVATYNKPEYLGGRVPVPAGYWKIVYSDNTARYFFAENKDYAKVTEYGSVDISKITTPNW